ncbi:glycosyltransferase [Sporolactobacillus terrae]|uniref:Glycosyl transferase n=1 Tax=Sporolactobacillus terrae TaxID=269673 RepID=A0A5K7WTL2_9BACL|nr:glycosyltransferase [Sporolactobacillus terrae]BBN97845.1 glycosyl transferase [Sporolactobacillus terrae]
MKILHVCEYANGGISTYLNELLKFQAKDNSISEVNILMSDHKSQCINIDGVNVYQYKYKRSPIYFIGAMIRIQKLIKQIKPDIVHIHSTFAGVFVRLPLFFQLKKKYRTIYCAHGWSFMMSVNPLYKKIYGYIERFLAKKTDLIINISKHEFYGSQKYRIPKKKSIVIPNGVSTELHLLPEEKVSIGIDQSKINLLFVGRFDRQKGLDILIDFFNQYKFENVQLYLLGSPVLNSETIHYPCNIFNLGWVDNSIIDSYYEWFDAIIIPSRWEGFGLVAIEAMKNNKAVIASDRGALPEIVHDGINGYLFNIEDYTSLKNILIKLTKDNLRAMGNEGYKIFLENYTSNLMNTRIVHEYHTLLPIK